MPILSTLALLAIALPQGPIGPIHPTGPIVLPNFRAVNLVADPGFESATLTPWQTGGYVSYWDKKPDGSGADLVGQALSGFVTSEYARKGRQSFRMNSEYPDYVLQGAGYASYTYVRQNLATPVFGSALIDASAWVSGDTGFEITIDYTSGPPKVVEKFYSGGWQRWDFRSLIDPDRKVKAIGFMTRDYNNGPAPSGSGSCYIDDVSLTVLVRI